MSTVIELSVPIKRGKKEIKELKFPKLTVPLLKGFALADIIELNFGVMPELISRLAKISEPECDQLEPYDLSRICRSITEAIMTKPDKPHHIDIRKPDAGSLRGISLFDLLQSDIDAMSTVTPRISSISKEEFESLELYQVLQIGKELNIFFGNPPN